MTDLISVPRALLVHVCKALSEIYTVEQNDCGNVAMHADSEKEREAINALMKYAEQMAPPDVANASGYVEMSGVHLDGQGQATKTSLVAHRGAYLHLPPSPPPGRVMHHGDGTIGWDEP